MEVCSIPSSLITCDFFFLKSVMGKSGNIPGLQERGYRKL